MAELSVVQINNNESPEFVLNFDTFWLLWPAERRVCKKEARAVWAMIDPEKYPEILTAVVAWGKVWRRRGEWEYVKHPHRWLRGEQWEDALPVSPTISAAAHVPFTSSPHEPVARGALPAHVLEALRKLTGRKP